MLQKTALVEFSFTDVFTAFSRCVHLHWRHNVLCSFVLHRCVLRARNWIKTTAVVEWRRHVILLTEQVLHKHTDKRTSSADNNKTFCEQTVGSVACSVTCCKSTQMWRTDRQTDRQTDTQHRDIHVISYRCGSCHEQHRCPAGPDELISVMKNTTTYNNIIAMKMEMILTQPCISAETVKVQEIYWNIF